jgi:hypothetical protein
VTTTAEQKQQRAQYMREWRAANLERAREISRAGGKVWRQKPGNQAKVSLRNRVWRKANPEKARAQTSRECPLARGLRNRMNQALRRSAKGGSAVRDLGCTIPELRAHLEAQFAPGMSWDNWTTNGWHIDHIIPLAAFDLADRKQFQKAAHFTNLQPLWAADNYSKGARDNGTRSN